MKIFLYNTIIMHACHYTFIQTHRMYNTKSVSLGKLWALGDYEVSMYIHSL